MNPVSKVLRKKGSIVHTINKDATVLDALRKMGENNIGSLVVVENEKPVGIFTERDNALRVSMLDINCNNISIKDVMTRDLITITPGHTVNQCMNIMTDNHIRHLPVVEDGNLVGMISIGDIVKDVIEELEFTIEQMEKYIHGLR
ncbi:MAG: CBS domain-containing protein [Anaerolineales bacterium]|nr:CBS domain-containing protein [Anaerolineales bacterium]